MLAEIHNLCELKCSVLVCCRAWIKLNAQKILTQDVTTDAVLRYSFPTYRPPMCMRNPLNDLLDLRSEISAVSTLRTLIFELKQDARSTASFDQAIKACQNLCMLAQAPNYYLGIELIRILGNPYGVSNQRITALINAFMFDITTQIDIHRSTVQEP